MFQIKKSIFTVLSVILFAAFSSNAMAQCANTEKGGFWRIYLAFYNGTLVVPMRCSVGLSNANDAVNTTNSTCWSPLQTTTPIPITGGTLTVASTCEVKGTLSITGYPTFTVNGWLNKDQNSVSGMIYSNTTAGKLGTFFSGQRQ